MSADELTGALNESEAADEEMEGLESTSSSTQQLGTFPLKDSDPSVQLAAAEGSVSPARQPSSEGEDGDASTV